MSDLADAIGVARRTLHRLVRQPWDAWTIGRAEALCKVCGYDLWDLRVTGEQLRGVDWTGDETRVLRALRDAVRSTGKPADRVHVQALADGLAKLAKRAD